jgi:hypothetical protein
MYRMSIISLHNQTFFTICALINILGANPIQSFLQGMFQSARLQVLHRNPCCSFQEVSGYKSSQIPTLPLNFLHTTPCNLDFVFVDFLRLNP